MDELDYWRLCDDLNVVQASMLIVGGDPSTAWLSDEGVKCRDWPKGYDAAKTAIIHALRKYAAYEEELGVRRGGPTGQAISPSADRLAYLKQNSLKGTLVPCWDTDINGNRTIVIEGTLDSWYSTVDVAALKVWLKERGFSTGFFFPVEGDRPDYLDPRNPRYAPKLAAAIHAWLAVTDPGKKSPKQALDKWLRENAAKFGLADDEGLPINQAVQECSKVANWQQGGGAPKTPS